MKNIIIETLLDTAKTLPYLFIIYIFLELIQKKIKSFNIESVMLDRFAPVLGSLVGCFPQCGFSTVAATLYSTNLIKTGTLISVFLATSDEAIPVLFSSKDNKVLILYVILSKLVIAIITGYVLNYTIFKNEKFKREKTIDIDFNSCECGNHHHKEGVRVFSILKNAMYYTLKIAIYILITLLIINLIVYQVGESNFSNIIFKGNKIIQPLISALIGIIPGCAISVLISQLLIEKQMLFGSAIAGLCTNAGFAYIILFKNIGIKKTVKIIAIVYLFASLFGIIINFLGILDK